PERKGPVSNHRAFVVLSSPLPWGRGRPLLGRVRGSSPNTAPSKGPLTRRCAPTSPPKGEVAIALRGQRSLHRRHLEFRSVLDAAGPAGGHRLGLGPELDRIGAVLVEIAEGTRLPTAEA